MRNKKFALATCMLMLTLMVTIGKSQNHQIDSLKKILPTQNNIEFLATSNNLSNALLGVDNDEALKYIQRTISLATELGQPKALNEASLYLGRYYVNQNQYDSAMQIYNDVVVRSKKNKLLKQEIEALTEIGNLYFEQMRFDTATHVLGLAMEMATENGYTQKLPAIYNGIANIIDQQGNQDSAIALYLRTAQFYEKSGDLKNQATVLSNMAASHMALNEYIESIDYLTKAIELNQKISNEIELNKNYNNLGVCYKAIDSLNLAIEYYSKSLEFARKNSISESMAQNYTNIGILYHRTKLYIKSEKYFDSSLTICRDLDMTYGILLNKANLGDLFNDIGEYQKSISYAKESLDLVSDWDLPAEKMVILKNLYFAYKGMQRPDSALKYHEAYLKLNDEIGRNEMLEQIHELKAKYGDEKKQHQIVKLNEDLNQERLKLQVAIIILISTFFTLLITAVIIYYRLRDRKRLRIILKKEKQILKNDLQSKEKELAFNTLQMVRNFELSENIARQLKNIIPRLMLEDKASMSAIIRSLHNGCQNNAWEEFEMRFENVHQQFYAVLTELYPGLSPNEVKICSLLKLNMTSKDIATLTQRSSRTIENTRSIIRKKMDLTPETNLTSFLLSI